MAGFLRDAQDYNRREDGVNKTILAGITRALASAQKGRRA